MSSDRNVTELNPHQPDIRQPVVCIVDDDFSVRRSISRLLEFDGFRARAFSEPEAFLKYVATSSVQLAIVDIWMGGMTGMELLAHLCAKSPQTRLIFITGHADVAAAATVMPAGAFAFFIKPLDARELLSAVHRALGHPAAEKKADPATAEFTEHTVSVRPAK